MHQCLVVGCVCICRRCWVELTGGKKSVRSLTQRKVKLESSWERSEGSATSFLLAFCVPCEGFFKSNSPKAELVPVKHVQLSSFKLNLWLNQRWSLPLVNYFGKLQGKVNSIQEACDKCSHFKIWNLVNHMKKWNKEYQTLVFQYFINKSNILMLFV